MLKNNTGTDKTTVLDSDPTERLPQFEDYQNGGESADKTAAATGIRSKGQAKKRILDAVGKMRAKGLVSVGIDEAEGIVSSTVDVLYNAYETNSTVPTRESFAEHCNDREIGIVVRNMKKDPFAKDHITRKAVAGAVALAVVAGLGVGAWSIANAPQPAGERPAAVAQAEDDGDDEDPIADSGIVRFGIDAPSWNEESSPFIAHITGQTDAGEAVDFYHAVWADGSTDTVELDAGTYEVAWTSAINADGSIYRTPEEPTQVVVDDAAGGEDASADDPADNSTANDQEQTSSDSDAGNGAGGQDASASDDAGSDPETGDESATDVETPVINAGESFEQVPAEDVTQDDLDQILGDIQQAVGNGDETLSGDAGQGVIDSATGNAGKNPNADQDKIDQAGQDASGNVSEQPQTPGDTSSSDSGSGGTSAGGGTSTGSASSTNSSNQGGSATGGSSSSGAASGGSSQSQPQHTHNWVAQTAQQWVQDSAAWTEQVWVQDSAAWTETVQTGSHIQCSCGQTFSGNSEWSAHNREIMLSTGTAHSYSVVPTYETVHHEATGHYETVNHEATGHYETVTTGYRCSGCGATR